MTLNELIRLVALAGGNLDQEIYLFTDNDMNEAHPLEDILARCIVVGGYPCSDVIGGDVMEESGIVGKEEWESLKAKAPRVVALIPEHR